MLVIRLQRTGRKGHAQFRVVVQDSRRTPSSGRIVANLGSYNPHTKTTTLDKELAAKYMGNGAQPSDRVVRLLQAEGVALPAWVKVAPPKASAIRNADKLRRNRPAEEAAPVEEPAAEAEAPAEEAPAEEAPVEEAPAAEEAESSTGSDDTKPAE